MSAPRLRPVGVAQVVADICRDCPTPCAWQRDPGVHADACRACPLRRWGQWGACPAGGGTLTGDALAAWIERAALAPAAAHAPAIVGAISVCGGCTQTKHALGSAEAHPDPGVVI